MEKFKFNDSLKLKLIEFMRTRPFLCNTSAQEYKNTDKVLLTYGIFIKENDLTGVTGNRAFLVFS